MSEVADQFRIYALHLLDVSWPQDQINVYLELAVMAWNTSFISKPERIKVIESYIRDHECPYIHLGDNRYDTLEFTVALAHIKKALCPDRRTPLRSAIWIADNHTIRVDH